MGALKNFSMCSSQTFISKLGQQLHQKLQFGSFRRTSYIQTLKLKVICPKKVEIFLKFPENNTRNFQLGWKFAIPLMESRKMQILRQSPWKLQWLCSSATKTGRIIEISFFKFTNLSTRVYGFTNSYV